MQTETQTKQIKAWLEEGKVITGIEALNYFGCFRLPARIHDLRESGMEIQDQFVTLSNGKRIKEYWVGDMK